MATPDKQLQLLTEIRDLLRVLAEPQLAAREKRVREKLVQIVGRSERRKCAVLLMDGERTRVQIQRDAGIDQADLSRMMSQIRAENVGEEVDRVPKLYATVTNSLFGG